MVAYGGGVLALLVNVLFVAAWTIDFCLHTRRLTAPLLGTVSTGNDHHPDTATRVAEKGFQVCAVCAFENFKDAVFCSTCGECMVTGEAADSSGRNRRKRRGRT
ncbi:hypothetical protein PR003_g23205 [Phytophthora rubi]|uniref:Uncharacterized protein n=1 Tax=Phytophthora rubi TaxID=129364 RepID=A0A6A4D1F6_9STRA|nr:hypothetical protein PR003_g23205 [Phytophthora rubi]